MIAAVASATALSTEEFDEATRALRPRVAVFDCDGTLWPDDAGSGFMRWTVDQGLLPPERVDWLAGRYAGYYRGEVSELAICGEMVEVYAGLAESDLRSAAATFFERHIAAGIFPEMRALLERLQSENAEIWAVSSTNDWVIEYAVTRFGIAPKRVLAARVAIEDGLATDRLLDVPTDEGKVLALRRAGVHAPDAVFGNSVHDAAMLGIARRAFPVNPSPALAARAAAEGWPVFFPESVRPVAAG